jgi:hypothetical protein
MGCHTWFKIPILTDRTEVIKEAQAFLDSDDASSMSSGHIQMYQWAIDNEICEVCCELASIRIGCHGNEEGEWVLYQDIRDYSVVKYNKENGTSYSKYDPFFDSNPDIIEMYSDEPRIGGYPPNTIRSYDEMCNFMETGYTNEEGKHYAFSYDAERIENVMAGIRIFFEKHPDGIIIFG